MFKLFVILAIICCTSAQSITKLQWSMCGPGVIDFYNFDMTPIVIKPNLLIYILILKIKFKKITANSSPRSYDFGLGCQKQTSYKRCYQGRCKNNQKNRRPYITG